jgi:hypothetical protein
VLKSDAVAQAAFDLCVSTNLSRQVYNKDDPAESFNNMRKAISDAADCTLPAKKSQPLRKRQVSSRTKELYDQRRNNFETMSKEQRKTAQHSIVKSIRDDYLAYIDNILNAMEVADRTGNTRGLTRLRKMLSGNSKPSSTMPSKDMKWDPITLEKELLESWNKFLAQKFAQPDSDNNQPIEQTVAPEDRLSELELEEALKSLKTGKAPGWDGIPTEAYKFSNAAKKELFRIYYQSNLGHRTCSMRIINWYLSYAPQKGLQKRLQQLSCHLLVMPRIQTPVSNNRSPPTH